MFRSDHHLSSLLIYSVVLLSISKCEQSVHSQLKALLVSIDHHLHRVREILTLKKVHILHSRFSDTHNKCWGDRMSTLFSRRDFHRKRQHRDSVCYLFAEFVHPEISVHDPSTQWRQRNKDIISHDESVLFPSVTPNSSSFAQIMDDKKSRRWCNKNISWDSRWDTERASSSFKKRRKVFALLLFLREGERRTIINPGVSFYCHREYIYILEDESVSLSLSLFLSRRQRGWRRQSTSLRHSTWCSTGKRIIRGGWKEKDNITLSFFNCVWSHGSRMIVWQITAIDQTIVLRLKIRHGLTSRREDRVEMMVREF